jgi:hypothetical protein
MRHNEETAITEHMILSGLCRLDFMSPEQIEDVKNRLSMSGIAPEAVPLLLGAIDAIAAEFGEEQTHRND